MLYTSTVPDERPITAKFPQEVISTALREKKLTQMTQKIANIFIVLYGFQSIFLNLLIISFLKKE